MFTRSTTRIAAGLWLCGLLVLPAQASAQDLERFEGIIVYTGPGTGLSQFSIRVQEYTTDAEARTFLDLLTNEGWEKLEAAFLQGEKARFQIPGQLSHNVAFARSFKTETGRIVRFATARRISMGAFWNSTRSRDYAFALIELRLDENDEGSGIVLSAAKLGVDENGELDIESYGHPPFSITTVHVDDGT